jgi:hypothetical protein
MGRAPRHRQQREPGSGRRPKIGAGVADSHQARVRLRTARAFGVSPGEFEGKVLVEVHEHFDATGKKTGHTVITRESAWDEASRQRALRLTEYEDGLCKCGCGLPISVAHDPATTFAVDRITCRAGKAIKRVSRLDAKHAKDANKPDSWNDGLHYVAIPTQDERGKRGD